MCNQALGGKVHWKLSVGAEPLMNVKSRGRDSLILSALMRRVESFTRGIPSVAGGWDGTVCTLPSTQTEQRTFNNW